MRRFAQRWIRRSSFPRRAGSTRDAKRVCAACEVRSECLQFALEHDDIGRFGILGRHVRARAPAPRARHRCKLTPATPEVAQTHPHHIVAAGHVTHGHLPAQVARVIAAMVIAAAIVAVFKVIATCSPRKPKDSTRQASTYAFPPKRR